MKNGKNKWYAIMLVVGLTAGTRAVETTISCEKVADEVAVEVSWFSSPSKGYRLYGRSDMIIGGWNDLTSQVVTPGQFTTNLSDASYFFHAESYELPPPSPGMKLILAGSNSGTDPDFGSYSLTVDRFWMDEMEVSKEDWDDVALWASQNGYTISTNKGAAKAAGHPVNTVRWYDCALYCNAKSEMEGLTPCYTKNNSEVFRTYDFSASFTVECNLDVRGFRLPTSEEWEYAARGGQSGKRFPLGNTVSHADAVYYGSSYLFPTYDLSAGYHPSYWFNGDVAPYTAPVGDLPVNGYGLYNMVGNVMEFTGPATPVTWTSQQTVRGGSWHSAGDQLRCGDESVTKSAFSSDNQIGFRTVVSSL
ncbi:SUMF1/EgtB/PvdO family nonheme iron enzyme [Pontiellaceae bacterium B12227]|nr:SUMF1/EgtB/PvdO family nonheme iron enzyme [Pontiellaceae bacterium B12227]